MAKKFNDLTARTMTPESRARAAARTKALLSEMHLNELRRARDLSQEELAERLGATRPEVSRIESRTDLYVSTLRRFIEAMGCERTVREEPRSSTCCAMRPPDQQWAWLSARSAGRHEVHMVAATLDHVMTSCQNACQ